jgi:hypothetical protein
MCSTAMVGHGEAGGVMQFGDSNAKKQKNEKVME